MHSRGPSLRRAATRSIVRAGSALASLALTACQWRLSPPTRQDATIADAAADRSAIADAPVADAAVDVATRPTIGRCTAAGPTPPADPDPSSRLYHAASIERPMLEFGNGRGACLGDLDGDGETELVVPRADTIAEVYDPRTLCLRTTLRVREHARACAIGDLDGDGRAELALALNIQWGVHLAPSVVVGHVEPSSADPSRWLWREPAMWALNETRNIRGIGTTLLILDLDNDGDRELVVGGTVTQTAPSSDAFVRAWEFTGEGACGDERRCPNTVYNQRFDSLDVQSLIVTQLDRDPEPELVAELGCNRGGLHRFDQRWTAPVEIAAVGQPSNGAITDVDNDGALDYFAATTARCNGGVGPNAALRWLVQDGASFRYYTEIANPSVARNAQSFVVALDALYDPRPELFLCAREGDPARSARVRCDLYSVDRPFIDAEWSWTEPDAHPDFLSQLLVHDVDRDGLADVLAVSEARVQLFLQRNR